MNGGVDRVVVKTSKTERLSNLLEIIHDLGKAFFCKVGKDTFKLCYFSQHTQVFFEGSVSDKQLAEIRKVATEVSDISLDEFNRELVIEL